MIVIRLKRVAGLVVALLVLFSGTVLASPAKVAVTLPAFTVELNGVKIDNTYKRY